MAKEIREILIKVQATGANGLKSIAKTFKDVERNTKKSANALTSLNRGFSYLAGLSVAGLGVREITSLADSLTLARSRIQAVLGPATDMNYIMENLAGIAGRTRANITDITSAFSRFAVAGRAAGLSVDALLAVTQTFYQTALVGGATTSEASGAIIQLSQSFSRGVLRGQELISVASNMPILFAALKKEVEATGQNITKFAEEGGLTLDFVLKTMAKNFDTVDKQATKLEYTFGQTMVAAWNAFALSIDKINKRLGLNSLFNKALNALIDNFDLVAAAAIGLATLAIPAITAAILKLVAASTAFTITPIGAALSLLAGGAYLVATNFDKISLYVKKALLSVQTFATEASIAVDEFILRIEKFLNKFGSQKASKLAKVYAANIKTQKDAVAGYRAEIENLNKKIDELNSGSTTNFLKNLLKMRTALSTTSVKTMPTLKDRIAELNKSFREGSISIETYYTKLKEIKTQQLTKDFESAKISLEKFNEGLRKLEFEALQNQLRTGNITLKQFNDEVKAMNLKQINEEFKTGAIDIASYYSQLSALIDLSRSNWHVPVIAGFETYTKSIGNLATDVASGVTNVMRNFEDSLTNAIATGKYNFQDFANFVVAEIARIAVRMSIVRPLMQGLSGVFGTTAGTSAGSSYYDTSVVAANGAIVNKPTYFAAGASSLGIMGEAGPEAIMPLTKVGGSLGVKSTPSNVVVNITNNAGGEVSTSESTNASGDRVIDVLITGKVKEAITNGSLDRSFNQAYGLRRKGY